MTTTTDPEPIVVEAQVVSDELAAPAADSGLTLKDETANFARFDAFVKALDAYGKTWKSDLAARLIEESQRIDAKSMTVRLGGEKVATITITEPQPKVVVSDMDKLVNVAMHNFPSEVVTPEPVSHVQPAFVTLLTEKMVTGDENGVYFTDHEKVPPHLVGTEVPGLKFIPAPPPSTFSTRWASQDKKQAVLDSLMDQVGVALGIDKGDDQ